jgi:2-iminobutanoate/2-iminopropanoate deaminase
MRGGSSVRHLLGNLIPLFLVGACAEGSEPPQSAEYYPLPGNPGLPFSEAVRVGSMLYLSGQMGTDSSKKLVPGGIEAETRQTLENIKRALERHGSSLDRVVKCTVMMADMAEWPAMNRIYITYFPNHLPARSAFGASGLALGGRVEIECMAAVG